MALSTEDHILVTTTELPATAAPRAPRQHRTRNLVVGWAGVGVAVVAVAGLSIAVLRPDSDAPLHDNARTVIKHGSITAIDHRTEVAAHLHTPSETIADRGSVTAIDHRTEVAGRLHTPSETIAEHGSVTAIDHRVEVAGG
jgi:hypothetical protein